MVTMTWNKKNQQFALSVGLRPSSIEIAQVILRKTKPNKCCEVTVDLREINKQIGKHRLRGEYDRKTIKEAIAQLDEVTFGWFTIIKSWNWSIKTILVRPVEFALSAKSQSEGKPPKLPTGNPMFDATRKERANRLLLQNISKLDNLLRGVGMKCNQETLHRMWHFGGEKMSNIRAAVEYMLAVNTDKIKRSVSIDGSARGLTSPVGWLHDCLKYGSYLDVDRHIELPTFSSTSAISNFVRTLSTQTPNTA